MLQISKKSYNFVNAKHACFALIYIIMGRKNLLESSFEAIELFFDSFGLKSFSEYRLIEVINKNRDLWNIPYSKPAKQIILYLLKREVLLKNVIYAFSSEEKIIYSWKTKDEFTVISGIKSNSYFVYYSALFLHQLSLQIPKTIYLNFEHKSIMSTSKERLTQISIDEIFQGSQRKSSLSYSYSDKKIVLTNGKFTDKLGVIRMHNREQSFEYTDIERTLIDISVRPVYAGGVFEVLEAYKIAKPKLNVPLMAEYLEKLDFIYPYHQVIGFYLEKANYSETDLTYFKKEMNYNFYLTYGLRKKEFSQKWKLYYPSGF